MWVLLFLMGLLWFITLPREGFTDLSSGILRTTVRANEVDVDEKRVQMLEQLIDQQENQLEQINTVIATLKAQKNTV